MPPQLRPRPPRTPPVPNSRPGQPRLPWEVLNIVGSYLADDQAYATLSAIQATCRVNRSIGEAHTSRVLFIPIGRENRQEALDRVQEVVQAKERRDAIRVVICQASVADHRIDVVEAVVARVRNLLPNLVAALWWDGKLVSKNSPPTINIDFFRRVTPYRLRLTYLALACIRTFHQARLPMPCRGGPVVDLKISTDISLPSNLPRLLYLRPEAGPSSVIPKFRKVTISASASGRSYPVSLIAILAVQLALDEQEGRELTVERYGGNWFEGGGQAATKMLKALAGAGKEIHGTAIEVIVQCTGFHRTRDALPTTRQVAEHLDDEITGDSKWNRTASRYFFSTGKMPCNVRLTARKTYARFALAPVSFQGQPRMASRPDEVRFADLDYERIPHLDQADR